MKVQAAICWEPGRPLEIDEIELGGAEGRGVPGAPRGDGRVPHRRLHHERARPVGSVPGGAGPRGRGRGGGGRAGRHVARRRRPRDPALHPRVPQLQVLPVAPHESLRRAARDAGQGSDARRHQPAVAPRADAAPLHGHVDVRDPHRRTGDRAGEDPQGRAARDGLPAGLRRHHRHRRGAAHREGGGGVQRRGLRPGRDRVVGDPGRGHGGRRAHHRHRHESGEVRAGDAARRDRHARPDAGGRRRRRGRGAHRRRRRLHVRVHRQRRRDGTGAGVRPQGLGPGRHHRRGGRRRGDPCPSVPARDRSRVARHRLRRHARPHPAPRHGRPVPARSHQARRAGDRPHAARRDQPRVRPHARGRGDPERRGVRMTRSGAFERVLRADPELLRSIVNQAADAVCLHEVGGRILDVNRRMCETLGYSREELLALSVMDIDVTATREETAKAASKLVPGEPVWAERVLRRKDGSTFPIELSLSRVVFGERQLMLGIARDITDRKRAEAAQAEAQRVLEERVQERTRHLEAVNRRLEEEIQARERSEAALRESEERFRALAERGHLLAWEADGETWRFTYVGPRAHDLLGYPVAEWYRDDFWVDHLHPEDRERVIADCRAQSAVDRDYELEYRMMAADGRAVLGAGHHPRVPLTRTGRAQRCADS